MRSRDDNPKRIEISTALQDAMSARQPSPSPPPQTTTLLVDANGIPTPIERNKIRFELATRGKFKCYISL